MDGVNLYNQFLAVHKPQLINSGVPELFWQVLYKKLENETFDSGSAFTLYLIDYEDEKENDYSPDWTVCVTKHGGLLHTDFSEIYLIDHAWTFRHDKAREQLQNISTLRERMAAIMKIDKNDGNCVNEILKKVWKYCNPYSIQTTGLSIENSMPIWYVMDELGSGINHSNNPNFNIVPFLYIPTQTAYSLLFPIRDVAEGEQVTRDFAINNSINTLQRQCLLLPWIYTDLTHIDFHQEEPNENYFIEGHILETLPVVNLNQNLNSIQTLKVYAEYEIVKKYLTDSSFELVENENDADILWLTRHFKSFREFSENSPQKLINQFPYEYVLTIKDLLSIICRRRSKKHHDLNLITYPLWLPTTYSLKTELVEFVSYFQQRAQKNMGNIWIVKPFNLARGLDTVISDNLNEIIRLSQTGPKIIQKYIEKPVLYHLKTNGKNVKFDIRYVLLLKSVKPLEAYIYPNFFLRFSNKQFSLDHFDDYEKHFTVMNYNNKLNFNHIQCKEFLKEWPLQYPDHNWENIENDTCEILKEILLGAVEKVPPSGIGHSIQSRALYAADIILAWENARIQPKILEINWTPDCKRACEYYPNFFNDVFELLFLNKNKNDFFRKIF